MPSQSLRGCKSTNTVFRLPLDAVPPPSQTQGKGVLLWSSTPDHLAITNLAYTLPDPIKPHLHPLLFSCLSLQHHDFHHRPRVYRKGSSQEARQITHGYALSFANVPVGIQSHADPPGYFPDVDESGKEKWPRGDEKTWKEGLRAQDKGRIPQPNLLRDQRHSRYLLPFLTQSGARRYIDHEVYHQPCSNFLVPSGLQPRHPRRLSGRRTVR